ncbi:hypothetical protein WJ968_16685 [Achromobacter xylosoxidans]
MTATVLGQTLGLKTNDQSNLSEVSSNLAVSVNASIRVGLNYDVEGAVYRDANANGHLDAEEGGVGATLWVKLTPRAGGQCQAPALDVVVADAASDRYHIKAAPAAILPDRLRQQGSGGHHAIHAGLDAVGAGGLPAVHLDQQRGPAQPRPGPVPRPDRQGPGVPRYRNAGRPGRQHRQ